jgi:hypothetical protein
MYNIRRGVLGIAIVGSLLGLSATAGFAGPQPTEEQRAACSGDYFRFCFSPSPNANTVVACLKSHKSQLSLSCRALFDK